MRDNSLKISYVLTVDLDPSRILGKSTLEMFALNGRYVLTALPPLAVDVRIQRGIGYENKANFVIYGLSLEKRLMLEKNLFDRSEDNTGRHLTFEAGYLDKEGKRTSEWDIIFRGDVTEAKSIGTRVEIEVKEMGATLTTKKGFISKSFTANATKKDLLELLLESLGLSFDGLGISDEYKNELNNPIPATSYNDTAFNILKREFPDEFFVNIDDAMLLKINECTQGKVNIISGNTGLLNNPIRKQTYVEIQHLFKPTLNLGQIIELQTNLSPHYNGQYKIQSISHNGSFYSYQSAKMITTAQLWVGTKALTLINNKV